MELTLRQQILVYLAATFFVSWLVEAYILKVAGTVNSPLTILLMFVPGAVAIFCSWFFGNVWQDDLGLRFALSKYWVLAYLVPAVIAVLILVISLIAGIGVISPDSGLRSAFRLLIFAPTIGCAVACLQATGEELGWRGFLYPRLKKAGLPMPAVLSGLIWAAWQWPLIFWGDLTPSRLPILSLILYTLALCGFSVFLGWLRERSRSIGPVILAHGVHICWIQTIYPGFYKAGPLDPFFGGETGFLLAILYLLLAIFILRSDDPGRIST